MEPIISKEEMNKYMSLKGETKGASFKGYGEFILKEEGEEGLKKLEETMAKLGHPIKYREMKEMTFYPVGYQILTLELIKRLFNYDDEKFQEMGRFIVKVSLIVKVSMKYFLRRLRTGQRVPGIWRKIYTIGDFKEVEVNREKGYAVYRIENFHIHPILCQTIIGYIASLLQMIVGYEVIGEETKCVHKGDEYHEFYFRKKA